MSTVKGYAAKSATSALAPFTFKRRELGPHDVQVDILFCGVCHSDLHTVRNEWRGSTFPVVPGHEIIGKVTAVGPQVRKVRSGEMAGVGVMVDSCRTCPSCKEGLEPYCEAGATWTYNAEDKRSGGKTYGGYSECIVVDEAFVLKVPAKLDPAATAPLLCAGITTYSPLRNWKVGKGQRVGVVGLGGLGHMGVKFASALGAEVVVFTTSKGKKEDALRFGAHEVVISKDTAEMKKNQNRFDFILDTVSAKHDMGAYLALLKRDKTLVQVGLPSDPLSIPIFSLAGRRNSVASSNIGGLRETQEMLNFCAAHGIVSDIEKIRIQQINKAYERLLKSDVKYRFVIDMASLK
ncbi:MAG TPA: NAD(P)-dependent alcohol dehydrogenase [Spirochaetia bacterium]|nr:NAD(P)-dependent alcohol dehydrogenase [Spirochaetia bacterium]